MLTQHTTKQVAEILGVTPGRVRQLAKALGIERYFGRDRYFTDADVRKMRQRHTAPGPVPRRKDGEE